MLTDGAQLTALLGHRDVGARPELLMVYLRDRVGDRYRVPYKDRPDEPDPVVARRDRRSLRLLDHQRGGRGRETYGEHPMGYAFLVGGALHGLFVHMVGVQITRDAGEKVDVGLAYGLAEGDAVAYL